MKPALLEVSHLSVRISRPAELTIVDDVSFAVDEGQWLMIVGPNGAGKSTIVAAITRTVPYTGQVRFAGADVRRFRPAELARRVGVLAQGNYVNYAFTVEEVVRLGRYAHRRGFFGSASDNDAAADADETSFERAIDITGLRPLLRHSVLTLSGGERQRAFLAQLLAQDPKVLILDEPTNHLDLVYQKQVFELIQDWLTQPGRAVISVVHDLGIAKSYGTQALLLNQGRVVASGSPDEALTAANLNAVYKMDVQAWMRQLLAQFA